MLEINATAVTCDEQDEGPTTPRIRVLGLLVGLHFFLDNNEVALDVNGEVAVTPGLHNWAVKDGEGDDARRPAQLEVDACTTASTPTPTVVSETPTPAITPPSTDTGFGSDSNGHNGLPLVLVALAGVIATALILSPRRKSNR